VKVFDKTPLPDELLGKVGYVQGDVREYDELERELSDTNLLIHTAIIQIPLINEKKRLGYQVNYAGTENICRLVDETPSIKGMILIGSWHTMGEVGLQGTIDEEFGFRPDKVEERAKLYVLSKIAQESIVRFYDSMSDKIYCVIRSGTILGEGMPEKTAVSIFINNALSGKPLTPFRHSLYRPMLYVAVEDVCLATQCIAEKILTYDTDQRTGSPERIVNIYYPKPITILDVARIVSGAVVKYSAEKITPRIEICCTGSPILFDELSTRQITVDTTRVERLLSPVRLKNPKEVIEGLVKARLADSMSEM
jgi:UDP-glucose 4-epimerase